MAHVRRLLGAIRGWPLLPVAVACAGLTATLLLTRAVDREAEARNGEYLEHEANLVEQRLGARLAGYQDVLLAGAGLFTASDAVTAEEWLNFLESMRVSQRYPGFRSLGYAEVVDPAQLRAFEASLGPGAAGVHWFGDTGPGDGPAYVVRFVEPLEENRGIIGLAFEGEPVRREAADLAAVSGEVVMTRPIRLARDGADGFVLFAPVYKTWPPPLEADRRLAETRGWVFAAFVSEDFFRGAVGLLVPEVEVRVSDGTRADGATIFDSGGKRVGEPEAMMLLLGGRLLRVEVWRGETFPAHNAALTRTVVVAGIALSLLSAVLVWLLQTWRRRAEGLAAKRTRQLEDAFALQRAIVDGAGLAIVATDRAGVVTLANPAAEALGWRVGLPVDFPAPGGKSFAEVIERVEAVGTSQCEVELTSADRSWAEAWVVVSKLPGADGSTEGYVIIARDITAEKAAQRDLDRVFAHSIDMIAVVTARGRFRRVSPAWERTLGWKEEELLGQSLWHFVHPDDRAEQIARARAVLEGQDVHDLRGRFR
ncbi:CHASE domain-containing protein, partial [Tepidiforma sp.]|uniref:CHASE domain-containing protein n=1 Tax=Tepidiforma sp. TaxID=2682230 RepID=UPI002ADD5038